VQAYLDGAALYLDLLEEAGHPWTGDRIEEKRMLLRGSSDILAPGGILRFVGKKHKIPLLSRR